MGHHDAGTSEYDRDTNRENGALLIYLGLRDIHALRSSIVQMKKNAPPDLDP